MKTFIPIALAFILLLASCNSEESKVEKLKSLKKKHDRITKQIRELEEEIGKSNDPSKDLMVSFSELKLSEFNHYIKVQGRDGEENVAANSKTVV
ncbi:MAG: hypothetical protein MZU79_02180 [Anaerotruncus sp.]|nr:hypothetical protein [Anaerotruncus sp.]